jgi:hypothetical protein
MFNLKSRIFLKSSLIAVFCCFSGPVLAQTTPSPSPSATGSSNNGYSPEVNQALMDGCRQTQTSQAIQSDQSQKTCLCFVKNLESRITFDKLQVVLDEAQKSGKPSPVIQQVLANCAASSSIAPSQ